jgi:CrcB protein
MADRSAALWLAIAAGGATGSVARAAVATLFAARGWPLGTWGVNIVGSALLGALAAWLPSRSASPVVVAALTTGLCGGFTTMSTMAWETVQLWQQGAWGRAALYAVASAVCSVCAAAAGWALGHAASTS